MERKARQRGHRRRRDEAPAAEAVRQPSAIPHIGVSGRDAALVAAIVLLAFALRLTYVLQLRSSPLFEHPQMDELYHDQWAQAIAAGEAFIDGPYFRAPLYPAFLAAIYKVFGHDYLAPRVIQAVLGSLSCGLLFLVGRRVFGRAVGAVAGFAAASYWMLIYFDGELLIPSLIVFLDLLLIWLLLRAAGAPGKLVYGLAGLALGLSAIARPNILLFGPAIVIWLVVVHRKQLTRALMYAACVTAGCLLAVLPITVRNYIVGKDLVLIASQGGVNFYIGNNPLSNGRTAIVPGTPGGWWEGYYATVERAEQARGRKLKPSEVSQYYYGEAWEFICRQPAKFLALTGLKLSLFWSKWEIPNNKGIYFWTEQFAPVVKLLPLRFGVLGPLGILGLALCWRRRGELFPLWGFVLVYVASVVAFFCNARYRTPVLPALILLAAYAVFQGIRTVRQRRWKPVMVGLPALALAAVFVNVTPGPKVFRNDADDYWVLGIQYTEQGRPDLAIESYRQSLELNPDFLSARFNLGTLLAKSERLPEAIAEFRRALTARPRLKANETTASVAAVHSNLATALAGTGAYGEAVGHYRAAIELDPVGSQGRTQFNLGVALGALGRAEKAIEAFEQVVAADPDDRGGHYLLARLLVQVGRDDQAARHFRQVLRLDPDNTDALYGLGRALFVQGRYEEALAPLQECVRSRPNNIAVLDHLSDALMRVARYEEASDLLYRTLPLGNPRLTNRLAFLLATCPDDSLRNGAKALEYARQACPQVEWCEAAHLDTLAAALAETGRHKEAAEHARQALQRARRSPRSADHDLIDAITQRLKLYESGRPYRLPRP